MRKSLLIAASISAVIGLSAFAQNRGWHVQDPQAAAGDWEFDVHMPADCSNVQNIEVNFPKPDADGTIRHGGVIHIECNLMPVEAK